MAKYIKKLTANVYSAGLNHLRLNTRYNFLFLLILHHCERLIVECELLADDFLSVAGGSNVESHVMMAVGDGGSECAIERTPFHHLAVVGDVISESIFAHRYFAVARVGRHFAIVHAELHRRINLLHLIVFRGEFAVALQDAIHAERVQVGLVAEVAAVEDCGKKTCKIFEHGGFSHALRHRRRV